MLEAENALLKERKEKIQQEIDKNLVIMTEDLTSRRSNAEEALKKFHDSQQVFEGELAKKDTYKEQTEQSRQFAEKFEGRVAEVEQCVNEYERIVQDSMRDFEEPLKKVDKVV